MNRALWLVGTAVGAAYAVAVLIYGPDLRAAAEKAAHQQIMAEHSAACDRLGKGEGSPGREACLTLLLQLQHRHEQVFMARTASPL